ncbi:Down syndrome cell adhesion molecule-like protein Dscam2, partial [Dinothrombium tinctorium]
MKSESEQETTPVTGFILHQKKGDSVEWEETRLPGDRRSHVIDGLLCGTRYQYYLIAYNAVGKGDPSDILPTKTDGMAPVAPDKHSLLSINATSAKIHLDAWHDGGCPITNVKIMYKVQKSKAWISIGSDDHPVQEKDLVLNDLLPSTNYELKITATNEGGPTEAQYTFTTLHIPREVSSVILGNEASASPSYIDVSAILATCISVLVIFLVAMLLCMLLARRRQSNASLYGTTNVYDSAKCQSQAETLRLSDLDQNHVKKLSGDSSSGLDSGYYPSPYAMTKIEANERGLNALNANQAQSHTSPMKPHTASETEPLYATVKRTPRPPRSDVHIYHYPMSMQAAADSGCDTESWKSATTGALTGAAMSTAFMRIQEEPSEKALAGNEVQS